MHALKIYRSGPSLTTSTEGPPSGLLWTTPSAWTRWWCPTLAATAQSSSFVENLFDMGTRWDENKPYIYFSDEIGLYAEFFFPLTQNHNLFLQVWALCTSDGCGVWFEPYCGRDTLVDDQGLGQGPNVVLDLVTKVQVEPFFYLQSKLAEGSKVYYDNLLR